MHFQLSKEFNLLIEKQLHVTVFNDIKDLKYVLFYRKLSKEKEDLVRTKNQMSLDLERLLNQREVGILFCNCLLREVTKPKRGWYIVL